MIKSLYFIFFFVVIYSQSFAFTISEISNEYEINNHIEDICTKNIINSNNVQSIDHNNISNKTTESIILSKILQFSSYVEDICRSENILDKFSLKDLKIINSLNDNNLLNKIDNTQTIVGKMVLMILLSNANSDIDKIKTIQRQLKFLIDNPDIIQETRKLLNQYHQIEKSIVSLWSTTDELYQIQLRLFFKDTYYFGNKYDNNSFVLETKRRFKDFFSIELPIIYPILIPLSYTITQSPIVTKTKFLKYLWGSSIPYFRIFYKFHFFNNSYFKLKKVNTTQTYVFRIIEDLVYTLSLYEGINCYKLHKKNINILSQRMYDMKKFIAIIYKLNNILNTNEKIMYIDINNNRAFLKINKYLKSLKSSNISYLFHNVGKLLASYNILIHNLNKFRDIIFYIGFIDVLTSLANDFVSKKYYTFVNFINSETPYLSIKDMSNPFLINKKVVYNDVLLSKDIKTINITGPNAGGKTTYISGIAYNIILAQSFGIALAKQINMTVFHHIYTNIFDSTVYLDSEYSSFTSKMKNTNDVINQLKRYENNFSLLILNNLFTGTDANVGSALEYVVVDYIHNTYKNTLLVYSSNYIMLTKLESLYSNVKNYKVFVIKNQNNKIIYTYKIIPGYSSQLIALDILKQNNYDDEIIMKSQNIIKTHYNLNLFA